MNKGIFLLAMSCLSVAAGCSSDYTDVDVQGSVIEVNTEKTMILIEDQTYGPVWIDASDLNDNTERLHSPLEVNVWLAEPVNEDHSIVGKAARIDVIK